MYKVAVPVEQIKCKTVTGKTIWRASNAGIMKLLVVAVASKFM